MSNNPLVSIIMPTYNVEKYLPAAIDSVLRQSYSDWELLVVDDGSTDNSNAVAQKYAQNDKRIHVLSKANGGLSDARNYGLSRARGKYLHFFDSDDLIETDFYEKMVAAIEVRNDDFVICGYYKDYELTGGHISSQTFRCDEISTPLPRDISYNSALYYYAWNKLYRNDFLSNNHLFFEVGLSVIEDVEFFSRVIDCSPSFRCIDYLGYRYQIRKRPTLGNEYTEKLIPSQLRSISIQCSLLEKLCDERKILQCDQGHVAFTTIKWVLHCIYSYSDLSFMQKLRKIKLLTNDKTVSMYIGYFIPSSVFDKLLNFFLHHKFYLFIAFLYSLKKRIKR